MFIFDNLHPLSTDALTTYSDKWLDVYRRRPQCLELDLLEYGNPTQHQRGRDKKLTYGDGGEGRGMHPCPPAYAPATNYPSRPLHWACLHQQPQRDDVVMRLSFATTRYLVQFVVTFVSSAIASSLRAQPVFARVVDNEKWNLIMMKIQLIYARVKRWWRMFW